MKPRALAIGVLGWLAGCNVINPDLLTTKDAGADASSTDASTDQPEPGLILRYEFEDSGTLASDISGLHKDGTVFLVSATAGADAPTSTAWTTDGRDGRGIALIGQQYVGFPGGVLAGIDDFTIATWVKVNTTLDWARIYDFGNGSQFMYLTIRGFPSGSVTPDGIQASSFVAVGTENVFATNTSLPTSVWKHVAVTGSGGDRQLYIDGFPAGGVSAGPVIPPRQMEPTAQNSWIGKSHFAVDAKLNGTVDDFRIYNRVLTPTQVADLAWPKHDYSYWRFDEGSGTTAKDSSDNQVGATLIGGVTWGAGRLGGAANFPGAAGAAGATGPHIALAASPLAACNEFTVAVWVKPQPLDASRVFDFGTGAGSYVYLSLSDGVGLHFGMAAPGKGTFDLVSDTQPLTGDGTWHHVAVTLQSGRATIYVDGMSRGTKPGSAIKPSDLGATTENWLGRSRAGDRFFTGALDDLRVACRAYTPDEIINLSQR